MKRAITGCNGSRPDLLLDALRSSGPLRQIIRRIARRITGHSSHAFTFFLFFPYGFVDC
jgi:hypothetical protein